jgi:hypothetical protein
MKPEAHIRTPKDKTNMSFVKIIYGQKTRREVSNGGIVV